MKKPFLNLRIPVIIACSLVFGVVAGYIFVFYNLDFTWFLAAVPLFLVPAIIFALLKKKTALLISLICLLVFCCGVVNCSARAISYRVHEVNDSQTHYICGTVAEKYESPNGAFLILDNATSDNKKLSGKIRIGLKENYGEYCEVGYKIEFSSTLSNYDLFENGKLNYYAEDTVKYYCYSVGGIKSEYGFNLFGQIRVVFRRALYDNLDKDTASICYAMLIGDTKGVDDAALDSFRFGGVAHIFAVSGLHIGLVYGVIAFAMKKLRANKFLSAAICIAVILLYSAVCGFTLSSVRAVIMCAVGIISNLFYAKRDMLNSLAAAVFIILLVTPLSLFSVGFQLSVCAVGGIGIFSSATGKLLGKLKIIPRKLAGGIGVTLGATAGTFPVSLSSFGYVSGAGVLLNIVVIPLVSVFFQIIFAATILTALIPQVGAILPYAVLPLQALLSFLLSAGFENALITGFGAGWFPLFYCLAALTICDKFNFKAIPRAATFTLTAVIAVAFVLLKTFTPVIGHEIAVSANGYGGAVIFKSSRGKILVTTEGVNAQRTVQFINEEYSSALTGVIILGGDGCATVYDPDWKCGEVYISDEYLPLQPYKGVNFNYLKGFTIDGISFVFIDGYTLIAECDGVGVCVSYGDLPEVYCDLLISRNLNYDENTKTPICEAKNTAYFSLKGYEYNVKEYGSLKYRTQGGKLSYEIPIRH